MDAIADRLVITNDTRHLASVREMVRGAARTAGFPAHYIERVVIAVDEAVTNIIEHAYPGLALGEGTIVIEQQVSAEEYRVRIVDDGVVSFDPDLLENPLMAEHVAAGRRGGLGVFLMRQVMDVVRYEFERERCNRLTLIKRAG